MKLGLKGSINCSLFASLQHPLLPLLVVQEIYLPVITFLDAVGKQENADKRKNKQTLGHALHTTTSIK